MESEGAAWFWALPVVLGPVLLGIAVAYGIWQWRRKSSADRRLGEIATRINYAAEDQREERLDESFVKFRSSHPTKERG